MGADKESGGGDLCLCPLVRKPAAGPENEDDLNDNAGHHDKGEDEQDITQKRLGDCRFSAGQADKFKPEHGPAGRKDQIPKKEPGQIGKNRNQIPDVFVPIKKEKSHRNPKDDGNNEQIHEGASETPALGRRRRSHRAAADRFHKLLLFDFPAILITN